MRILVTGATGYVGGRLVPRLLERGHEVRVLVRDPARIAGRPWAGRVEALRADMLHLATLTDAFEGIDAAAYLVHAMGEGRDFEARDRLAAESFAAAAIGLPLVVYLGGLQPAGGAVTPHLRSRAEVGEILRARLPATELRAGPIVGSGSASFEMVRYLTERLPVMLAPRWVKNEVQPIAIRDVLAYLAAALEREPLGVVEIGGERLSFADMMRGYAAVRGLRRRIVPVPVLAPKLAARWVEAVAPIPNRLAVPLIEGVIRPVVADTTRARELFPAIEPLRYREAVTLALATTERGDVETRWSGALGGGPPYRLADLEGLIREERSLHVAAPPAAVYQAFAGLGGERGWLAWRSAWAFRGFLDRLVGGPGLRRGRRHPQELWPGEALDFWRVEAAVPPELLRLRAEMRVPGRAWLEFRAIPEGDGTRLVQTALFAPRGLAGTLYWYALYPLHRRIFRDLVRAVAGLAEGRPRGRRRRTARLRPGWPSPAEATSR